MKGKRERKPNKPKVREVSQVDEGEVIKTPVYECFNCGQKHTTKYEHDKCPNCNYNLILVEL